MRASMVVMFGFVIGSAGEVNFSWLGLIFGVISSAFVSLYSIYVKKVMVLVGNDQWYVLLLSLFTHFIGDFLSTTQFYLFT
jgi:hypothetical protein